MVGLKIGSCKLLYKHFRIYFVYFHHSALPFHLDYVKIQTSSSP